MARIEGTYQRFLKTIPKEKIITLTPKVSEEIDLAISEAFRKKFIESRKKQLRSYLLTSEYWRAILNLK